MKQGNLTKRPTGRPSTYTQALADKICARLAAGDSLRKIARDPDMPVMSTIILWDKENRCGFSEQYARSRDVGLEVMAEETLSIADDGSADVEIREKEDGSTYVAVNSEVVARSRLRVDTRKWYLSKLAPKRYGERLAMEVSGELEISSRLLEARKRLQDNGQEDGKE